MRKINKKNTTIILVIFLLFSFFLFKTHTVSACTEGTTSCYKMLSPLPGLGEGDGTVDVSSTSTTGGFGNYLNSIIKLIMGIVGFLAVVMVIIGGMEYMISGGAEHKTEGKDRIMNALFGLTLALTSWLILNTINPSLVNLGVTIQHVDFVQLDDITQDPGDDGEGVDPTKNADGTYTAPASVCATDTMVLINKSDLNFNGLNVVQNSFTLNPVVRNSLIKAFKDYETNVTIHNKSAKAIGTYSIVSGGGYNCRNNRNAPTKWSAHAYGVAIDINVAQNANQKGRTTPLTNPPDYDLPDELIAAFTSNGWAWGGTFKTVKDPMHFSKAIWEGASGDGAVNK